MLSFTSFCRCDNISSFLVFFVFLSSFDHDLYTSVCFLFFETKMIRSLQKSFPNSIHLMCSSSSSYVVECTRMQNEKMPRTMTLPFPPSSYLDAKVITLIHSLSTFLLILLFGHNRIGRYM
jgi:hypothetical protein